MTNKMKSFTFKQFSISRGHSGMAVSTDGVLLGAWAQLQNEHQILDIGTGTGLLALMCAQRSSQSQIHAIDIDEGATQAAQHNVTQSPWADRIQVQQGNITEAKFEKSFDRIICNPPYFTSGELALDHARAQARHTITLSHQALLTACKRNLTKKGKASFILPKVEGTAFIELALSQYWFLSRLCHVHTTSKKASYRLLLELTLIPTEIESSELVIHQDNQYSEAFITLTQAFYLKM
ncbi:tRNA1(Val) (adenine(37)-N6)-methyltransferase [Vibrio sp. S17_S38]|uniref:tRNA1(Val) (adenine(37)-N6)-methyltransferase n=1 Tax=Vibrio sp. S17_S38 TaxID=2720229 RepID=UPI001681666F|nr:tRNA1(Val) (adenine(37)-N6)-methyltransferase [Vibrio sp. S17_S38]MBD1572798.1 tRNA1(Val) (adenine(37)-N6)-methyltransferase [Vibrio sp. S17_S38]